MAKKITCRVVKSVPLIRISPNFPRISAWACDTRAGGKTSFVDTDENRYSDQPLFARYGYSEQSFLTSPPVGLVVDFFA